MPEDFLSNRPLRSVCAALAASALGALAAPAAAGDTTAPGSLNFVVENDSFAREDRWYTSGLEVQWSPGGSPAPQWAVSAARWLPWFPREGTVRHAYAIGQSVFTASDITLTNPPLDDRPYAGWLYGTLGLNVETDRQLDQVGLSVGVVGPAALGEESQNLIHEIGGIDPPQGWETQLANELGVVATYRRSWKVRGAGAGGYQWDVIPSVGGALGNVYTYANAGLLVRVGRDLPSDYGPLRMQPGLTGTGRFVPADRFAWYAYAGFEGRAVARNVFLDGNTFRDSRSVDKEPLVADFSLGVVGAWRSFRVSYAYVVRSKEFPAQGELTRFGSLTVTIPY